MWSTLAMTNKIVEERTEIKESIEKDVLAQYKKYELEFQCNRME